MGVHASNEQNLDLMNQRIRSLLLGSALLLGSFAFAQPTPPFAVTISGQVTPCSPANSYVNIITVQGTQPSFDIDVPLDSSCSYSVTMIMDSWQGWFQVGTPCAGAMQYNTGSYAINNALDSTASVVIDISCGGGGNCQADFSVQQAMNDSTPIPWQITTTNQSTGPAPIIYQWSLPDGSFSTDPEPTFTFSQPGVYGICLTISAGTCTSVHCDSLVVDSMGFINNNAVWYDCQGTPWGPATPGTPCDDGNPATSNDTWSAACQCVGQGGGQEDCLGIIGGPNLPGTACADSTGSGSITGIWDANCICQPDSGAMDCLGIPGGTNLPGTACVDTAFGGIFTGIWDTNCICQTNNLDCLGIPNGPNQPGTPCSTPAIDNGTWSAACICVPDSTTTGCQANFWVIQAYTVDSLNPQDSTGYQPIPNEVWVWNLSTGGNGNYQFIWDFGDGTSSTEAFPTHVYGSDGPWNLCLTMTSGNCTDTYCDSVSVDADGILNELVIGGGNDHVGVHASSGERAGGFTLNVIQQIPTGITEIPAFTDLKVWPNPVNDALNISFTNSVTGAVPVTVIDPSGRTVLSESPTFTTGGNILRIPTDKLEQGLYMVRIGNGAKSVTKRFLKVR